MALDPNTPVLAATATITVRPDEAAPAHALELMLRTARLAAADAAVSPRNDSTSESPIDA